MNGEHRTEAQYRAVAEGRDDRRPVDFRQVCAIARAVILARPHYTDSEWRDSIKRVIVRQRFADPSPDLIARAMTRVERAMWETVGSRPTQRVARPQHPQPDRCWTADDYRALAGLLTNIAVHRPTSPIAAPVTLETLDMSEHEALDEFYRQIHAGADRLPLLRRFAELAIVRPSTWDYEAIRRASQQHTLTAPTCFGCLAARSLSWHHIIQIQHGGSNYLRNRVALCDECHHDVHPWLESAPRRRNEWESLSDVAPRALDAVFRKQAEQ